MGDFVPHQNEELGFALEVPAGWPVADGGVTIVSAPGRPVPVLTIAALDPPARAEAQVPNVLARAGTLWDVVEPPAPAELPGGSAIRLVLRLSRGPGGGPMILQKHFLDGPERGYILIRHADAARPDEWDAECARMLESFRPVPVRVSPSGSLAAGAARVPYGPPWKRVWTLAGAVLRCDDAGAECQVDLEERRGSLADVVRSIRDAAPLFEMQLHDESGPGERPVRIRHSDPQEQRVFWVTPGAAGVAVVRLKVLSDAVPAALSEEMDAMARALTWVTVPADPPLVNPVRRAAVEPVAEPPAAVLPADRRRALDALAQRLGQSRPHFWRWRRPGDYYDVGPLTDGRIVAAEEKLGVRLPDAYLALLSTQNGGPLRYNAHARPPSPHTGSAAVTLEVLWGVGPTPSDRSGTVDSMSHLAEAWSLPKRLFFLTFHGDYGGVALDYRRRKKEPAVVYVDFADEEVVPLAPDFMQFVDGLFAGDRDHAYGFRGVGADPDQLLLGLEAALGSPFQRYDPPDPPRPDRRDILFFLTQRFGWKSWFGSTPEDGSRIEFVPNRRPGTEYLEHPGHPECDWFLTADIDARHRDEFEQALRRLPFELVVLHLPPWEKLARPR